MSEEFYSLVTNWGLEKQNKCLQDGIPFDVSYIVLGDGNGRYYEPSVQQTALLNEVWRGMVEKCEWIGDKFYCVTRVPSDIGGFTIREAGIFDDDDNLIVITKFPETTKQAPTTGTTKQLVIRIEIQLVNKELASLVIDPNIQLATKDEVDELAIEISSHYQALAEKGQANGYAPLDEDCKIPQIYIPAKFEPFCFNSGLVDSDGNAACLVLDGNELTLLANSVCTTANGITYKVVEDVVFDISTLEEGEYNIFYDVDNQTLEVYNNKIYIQSAEPAQMSKNDVWVDISVAPLSCKVKDDELLLKNLVLAPAKLLINNMSGGGGGALTAYLYNENGIVDKKFMHLFGSETISGIKTFLNTLFVSSALADGHIHHMLKDTGFNGDGSMPENTRIRSFRTLNANNTIRSDFRSFVSTSGAVGSQMIARLNKPDGTSISAVLEATVDKNGNIITAAPTPATGDNSTKIATTEFVKSAISTATANGLYYNISVTTGDSYFELFSNSSKTTRILLLQWGKAVGFNTHTFPKKYSVVPIVLASANSGEYCIGSPVSKVTVSNFYVANAIHGGKHEDRGNVTNYWFAIGK